MALDKIRTELIADDAVTAAKIPAGAVGTTEIAEGALSVHALQNTTSHTLSGTYSDSKMYTSDAYVLGGDITVNSNLVLSSVKGDDSDITLTDDGTTRTITGTGKLEAGAILAKVNTDASTLTGELGSAVTGSPALNLGASTFPTGHVIQTKYVIAASSDVYSTTNGSWNAYVTNLALSITRTAGTKFMYMVFGGKMDNGVSSRVFKIDVVRTTGATFNSSSGLIRFGHSSYGTSTIGEGNPNEDNSDPQSLVIVDTTSVSGDYTYAPIFTGTDGGGYYFNTSDGGPQTAIGIEFIG